MKNFAQNQTFTPGHPLLMLRINSPCPRCDYFLSSSTN